MGALYPDSVPVVVEGISSGQHPKEVRKTTVISKKVSIRQGLKHAHALVQNRFPQEQRSCLPVAGRLEKNGKTDERPSNFGISGGLSNPIFIRTKAYVTSQPSSFNKEGRDLEIPAMLRKGARIY